MKNCKICGDVFKPKAGNQTLCSDDCRKENKKRLNQPKKRIKNPKIFLTPQQKKNCVGVGSDSEGRPLHLECEGKKCRITK